MRVTFGDLIKGSRLGFSVFRGEEFEAWMRLTIHEDGFRLEFRKALDNASSSAAKQHVCWWEGSDGEGSQSKRLIEASPFLQGLSSGQIKRACPFYVILNKAGEEA